MTAILIGARIRLIDGEREEMWRLDRPLHDVFPEWRNVVIRTDREGYHDYYRGRAYQTATGEWAPVPDHIGQTCWRACFQPLTGRDIELIRAQVWDAHRQRLGREQRAAYQAWQAAPVGPGWTEALNAYREANKRIDQFEKEFVL